MPFDTDSDVLIIGTMKNSLGGCMCASVWSVESKGMYHPQVRMCQEMRFLFHCLSLPSETDTHSLSLSLSRCLCVCLVYDVPHFM